MGVFSKLKGIFYDEVVEDEDGNELEEVNKIVKKEPKKEVNEVPKIEEVKYKTVDLDEPKEEVSVDKTDNTFDERDLFRSERTFNIVEFDDDEEDKIPSRRNVLNEQNRNSRIDTAVNKEPEKPKVFKPTPVISPIWGVLDKDYKKDEIQEKTLPNEKLSSSVTTYDTVRRKAYGTLEDELEDTLNSMEKISANTIKEEVNKVDKDVELLDQKTSKIEDLINKIEDATDELDKTMSIAEAEDKVELKNFDDDDEEEEVNDKTLTDSTLEHDLFNLIDSMYDDKEE